MRVGITGHQRLSDQQRWKSVREEINRLLAEIERPLVGVSSLAAGADQLFAELILQQGGTLECIIPFSGYERTFESEEDKARFLDLLGKANRKMILEVSRSDEDAFWQAGKRVVDESECLFAVWDGKPAGGLGGTADVVDYAQAKGKRIIRIDPGRSA